MAGFPDNYISVIKYKLYFPDLEPEEPDFEEEPDVLLLPELLEVVDFEAFVFPEADDEEVALGEFF